MVRPRILYEISQRLARLLEEGLREGDPAPSPAAGAAGRPGRSERVPVFLCHPLDAPETKESLEGTTVGILYPTRIVPELAYRHAGMTLEASRHPGSFGQLRMPSLWVRVRYAFLVAGGSLEDQLGAVAALLRTLHDHPVLVLGTGSGEEGAPPTEGSGEAEGSFPLRLVADPEGWRELGLPEHRMTVSFEVTVPIGSSRVEPVDPILEREVLVREAGKGWTAGE